MTAIFISAVAVTSLGGYLFGVRKLQLTGRSVGAAVAKMLECMGATLIFLAVNLALAAAIILAVRGLTGTFVSVYVADDTVWLGLSLLQGLTFQWWRKVSRGY
jgi:hypothetical protein